MSREASRTAVSALPAAARRRLARRRPVRAWLGAAAALFAVGWGANQFTAMLLVYRAETGISGELADVLFGVYAVSLVPAMLLGGPLSDRYGRRMVVPCVALSVVASGLLMAGAGAGTALLVAGRLLAGVASGLVFAPGTAWVRELTASDRDQRSDEQAGARRAAVALTGGFAAGPLVTGAIGQYGPHPLWVAYLPHVVVAAVALRLLRNVPETRPASAAPMSLRRILLTPEAGDKRFLARVVPLAPWVFAAPAVATVVLPSQVAAHAPAHAVLLAGLLTGGTLCVGVAVQPLAQRLNTELARGGSPAGMAAAAGGLALAALAVSAGSVWVAVASAVALGAAYGLCMVAGLVQTQRIAAPERLGGLVAVYYALTYVGFACPAILSTVPASFGYAAALVTMSAGAALTGAVLWLRPASGHH